MFAPEDDREEILIMALKFDVSPGLEVPQPQLPISAACGQPLAGGAVWGTFKCKETGQLIIRIKPQYIHPADV